MLGESGNDVNIWAPGDGSDAYVGDEGFDTHISAPFVTDANGNLTFVWHNGQRVPQVSITSKPQFTCTVEAVPPGQHLGFDYITRFFANGNLAVTIRLEDVERVMCPSPNANSVLVANVALGQTNFVERPLSNFGGVLGRILQP